MLRMDGDKQSLPEPVCNSQRSIITDRWNEMVGFFEYQPVRPTRLGAHRLKAEKKRCEEVWTFRQGDSEEVDVYVHVGVPEHSEDFADPWRAVRSHRRSLTGVQ